MLFLKLSCNTVTKTARTRDGIPARVPWPNDPLVDEGIWLLQLEASREQPGMQGEDLRLASSTGLKDQGEKGILIRVPDDKKEKALLLRKETKLLTGLEVVLGLPRRLRPRLRDGQAGGKLGGSQGPGQVPANLPSVPPLLQPRSL